MPDWIYFGVYYQHELVVIMPLRCVFQAKTTPLPNGHMQDEFEKTGVNMSTYLVAFIVADFTPVSKNVSETLVVLTQIWLLFAFSTGCTCTFVKFSIQWSCVVVSWCVYIYMSVCFRCLCTLCQRRRTTLTMLWKQPPNCWSSTITSLKLTTPSKN